MIRTLVATLGIAAILGCGAAPSVVDSSLVELPGPHYLGASVDGGVHERVTQAADAPGDIPTAEETHGNIDAGALFPDSNNCPPGCGGCQWQAEQQIYICN